MERCFSCGNMMPVDDLSECVNCGAKFCGVKDCPTVCNCDVVHGLLSTHILGAWVCPLPERGGA